MDKLIIGVLCPSEIAFRRFLPALAKTEMFLFGGVAVASSSEWIGSTLTPELMASERIKAEKFGGKVYDSYNSLLSDPEIDCVYLPLPPGLHFEWAEKALSQGKHLLIEKPSTDSYSNSAKLIDIANENDLAIHENYMFIFHNQISYLMKLIDERAVGEVRLLRADFSFPYRGVNDFRYNKAMGGGALLDCGGYPLKLAQMILGDTIEIVQANLYYDNVFDVDVYGNAVLCNSLGSIMQISFGMDNCYRCSLEIMGSSGRIFTNRVYSAPESFSPSVFINDEEIRLETDDSFKKSIEYFYGCIKSLEKREESMNSVLKQAKLVDAFRERANTYICDGKV